MAQQFNSPKSETELRVIIDSLYEYSREAKSKNDTPSFKGLIELMSSEATITTAIHNIKANHGSNTPGVDGKTMQKDYLQKPFSWVIKDIQDAFKYFIPQKIRRKYIEKPGKNEKTPLGIPTIRDRIVQECMRIILDPIFEAQFYEHSYGFRPYRDTKMALVRITDLIHKTGYFWVVEGDISKCFDKISHSVLLKRLYHMGVKDARVIQIIKVMLRAGIVGELDINEEGVPQGGILSPLLANIFLDIYDEWVSRQWIEKKTKYEYSTRGHRISALKQRSNLIPGYITRYADDFVIITDTRQDALWWKEQSEKFLWDKMKLNLSPSKTLITDVRKQYISFLGYEYKVVKGNSKTRYITRTIPNRERLHKKVLQINKEMKTLFGSKRREKIIHDINLVNSKIRGLINYYSNCTWVNIAMSKYAQMLLQTAKRRLKRDSGKKAATVNGYMPETPKTCPKCTRTTRLKYRR
jgi:group II intron reverse transcriptase/maturase